MNGNTANGGLLAKWRDEIIFARPNEWFLNTDDDFIYYSNRNDENRLYHKQDAKDEGKALLKTPCSGLLLYGDKLYFVNENDKIVYSCSTEGKGVTRCSNKETTEFAVLNDGEVYINPVTRRLCVCKERVFFADSSNDYALTSIEVKSGEKEVFANIKPSHINSYRGDIYYTDRMRENKIFRLGSRYSICGNSSECLHVIDDWLYFLADKRWKRLSLVNFGEAEEV